MKIGSIVSVNVGLPKSVPYRDGQILTGIFKHPVDGRVGVQNEHLDGDGQGDLSVHGGAQKAVYAYPSEHYEYWQDTLGKTLNWGAFGENLTTSGLLESEVRIGDQYRIGTAVLVVTSPRQPCFKLAMRLADADTVSLVRASGRSGFYLKVIEVGNLGHGDAVERVRQSRHAVSVADVNRVLRDPSQRQLLDRVLSVPDLSGSQRKHLEKYRQGTDAVGTIKA